MKGYDVIDRHGSVEPISCRRGLFSGPTRFLDDALGQRPWFAYRLRMPNGHAGLVELLKVNLALCDGVARHTVSQILEQTEEEWVSLRPRIAGMNRRTWPTGKSSARWWPPAR